MKPVIFRTAGDGFWSDQARAVRILDMRLAYIDPALDFGELRVYFDTQTWDRDQHGLIYTDRQFIRDLRRFLHGQGLSGSDVEYSEQGMQGSDYVSLDVGAEFLASWSRKFQVQLEPTPWLC